MYISKCHDLKGLRKGQKYDMKKILQVTESRRMERGVRNENGVAKNLVQQRYTRPPPPPVNVTAIFYYFLLND